jgi:hypothetical protein
MKIDRVIKAYQKAVSLKNQIKADIKREELEEEIEKKRLRKNEIFPDYLGNNVNLFI